MTDRKTLKSLDDREIARVILSAIAMHAMIPKLIEEANRVATTPEAAYLIMKNGPKAAVHFADGLLEELGL